MNQNAGKLYLCPIVRFEFLTWPGRRTTRSRGSLASDAPAGVYRLTANEKQGFHRPTTQAVRIDS